MLAAQGGYTETVKALIEAGADVNLRNWVRVSGICINSTFGILYLNSE